jgi:hypothetical protein
VNAVFVALLLQASGVWLDNDYVRVTRNAAPCGPGKFSSAVPWCGARVIVALSEIEITVRGATRKMTRGEIAVFGSADEAHSPLASGQYFEVAFKSSPPPVQSPRELVPPDKNVTLYDGEKFFVFEERLAPGETRARHGHSQRVVIQLNRTRLQQWPEGEAEVIRDIQPDTVGFNAPVIHTVKNIGTLPLRGIVIEFKPQRQNAAVSSSAVSSSAVRSSAVPQQPSYRLSAPPPT